MKDYVLIIIAIVVMVVKMFEANKKQKAEAEKRALAQRKPAQPEEYEIPPHIPNSTGIPTFEDIFGEDLFGDGKPASPPTPVPALPTATAPPLETIYEAEPFVEEAQSLEYIPEHPSKMQKAMPQLQITELPTLESLRTDEGDMNAPADNTAWEEETLEEIRCFNLRAAIIHSEILRRPYAT